ncbi:hypothetical protein [Desulfovibrio sp. TomC]|uniref:hypothetical protein n=1 Tax=Desulfovibrio sp. TomC TaxID=1562888 RepID=UPI000574AAEE|nr:hypothetical protein [Desulfovibrio sp. TomC]KHK00654.1 hypothetical protein NY78_3917 [Desulfovibrio sp. TomC]
MLPDIPEAARRVAIQAALATLLLLTLVGVIWLGIAAERANAKLSALTNRLDALALSAPTPAAEADQLASLTNLAGDVAALAKKIDALAADEAKATARLTNDIRTLAGRIDALAAARAAAEKPAGKAAAKAASKTPAKSGRSGAGAPDTPPPYYGPGYPAWPAY